jgi:UDP-glucuronate 4-epimerase
MKVLVTGGAGFVGSCLSAALLKRGDEVCALDNFNDYYSPEQKRNNVAALNSHKNFKLVEGDFTSLETVRNVFSAFKPDVVAHMGAMANVRYSVKNPQIFMDVNITGTVNLLEESVRAGVKNFIFASTSSVYGQTEKVPFVVGDNTDYPLAPYPASKKAGELLGHAYSNMHGLNFTALRFFNVYGPQGRPDMMPFIVAKSLIQNDEITLFDQGELQRDWTFIDDIVAGVIASIDKPFPYQIFNLGKGEPSSMVRFIDIMQEISGKKLRIKQAPAPASEPKITYANIDKTREFLGYQPRTSLPEGLQAFWDWYTLRQ